MYDHEGLVIQPYEAMQSLRSELKLFLLHKRTTMMAMKQVFKQFGEKNRIFSFF
jgi:hypothetical protein